MFEQFQCALPRLLPAQGEMDLHCLADLAAYRHRRRQSGHRLLKDHRDLAASDLLHFLGAAFQQVLPLEIDLPGNRLAISRQQAHNRQRSHRLAAAAFADQAQNLAFVEVQREAVDSPDRPLFCLKLGVQLLDLEQGHLIRFGAGCQRDLWLGTAIRNHRFNAAFAPG